MCRADVLVNRRAALLGYTTEQLTLYTSQTIGGLLNATLGKSYPGLLLSKLIFPQETSSN